MSALPFEGAHRGKNLIKTFAYPLTNSNLAIEIGIGIENVPVFMAVTEKRKNPREKNQGYLKPAILVPMSLT